ncbi:hypothetical protein [Streptomyces sp. NPDC088554]|uniref:hypothetical protein n=1 Tax=Streptomyces sp. NPDC088554 TaxID=3365865 RepID=UPI00380CDF5D
MTEQSRDERIEAYYHESAWDLAERIVDLEDELGADVDGICTGMHADMAEAHAEIERLRGEVAHLRSAWKVSSATRESYRRITRDLNGVIRELLSASSERLHERDRYRLAGISARRRAAMEANFATEALTLKDVELAQQEARRRSYTAELQPHIRKRMEELRRAHAFVAEVQQIRGWTMDGDTYRTHLRPIYDALHELGEAQREGRPYRDRWTRVGPEHMREMCPRCHMAQDDLPQPTPCTCDDEVATVAYWKAELERVHQGRLAQVDLR